MSTTTLTMTAAEWNYHYYASNLALLATSLGYDTIEITDGGDITVRISEASAIAQYFTISGYGSMTAQDTASNISAMDSDDYASLRSLSLSTLTVWDHADVTLTVEMAEMFAQGEISLAGYHLLSIEDSAANIASLDAGDISSLASLGISAIYIANCASLDLGISAYSALVDAGISIEVIGDFESAATTTTKVSTNADGTDAVPVVTGLADGGYVISWTEIENDDYNVYMQLYDASGHAVGSNELLNSSTARGEGYSSVVALAGGGFVVAWDNFLQAGSGDTFYGISYKVYDANGNEIVGETELSSSTSNSLFPGVIALSDGGFVIHWATNGDYPDSQIVFQRFDASGSSLGSVTQVNTTSSYYELNSDGIALSNGNFVISWGSTGADGSNAGVYYRIFNVDGNAVSAPIQVNTYTASTQDEPSIAALSDGGFVVVWESYEQDLDFFGVYMQRFDDDGKAVGSESRVNTTTAYNQNECRVVGLENGGFVVVFTSYANYGHTADICMQLYDAQGNKVGSETVIPTDTDGLEIKPDVAALKNGGFVISWVGNDKQIHSRTYDYDGSVTYSATDTAAHVSAMDAADVDALVLFGIKDINVSDAGAIGLTLATVSALHDNSVTVSGYGSITLSDTAAHIAALDSDDLHDLAALGISVLHVTDGNDLALSALGAGLLAAGRFDITGAGDVYLSDTAAHIAALDSDDLDDLTALGISVLHINDANDVALTTDKARALAQGDFSITGTGVPYVEDTAANLSDIDTDDVGYLIELGITDIVASDHGTVTISYDVMLALTQIDNVALYEVAALLLKDSAAAISDLTQTDVAVMSAFGMVGIVVSDAGDVTLSLTIVEALSAAALSIAGAHSLTMQDTAAHIAAMDSDAVTILAGYGFTAIKASTGADIAFDPSVVLALGEAGISFDGSGTYTTTGTYAEIAALLDHDSSVPYTALDLDSYSVADTVADLRLASSALSGLSSMTVADSGADIGTINAVDIAHFSTLGVTLFDAADDAVTLTVSQVDAIMDAGMTFDVSDEITLSDRSTALDDYSAADLAALVALGVTTLDIADGPVYLDIDFFARVQSSGLTLKDLSDITQPSTADDAILGSSEADTISALRGNDMINGNGGDDQIYGDQGDDVIYGSTGSDVLAGNQGDDVLKGGEGDDTLFGGAGDDTVFGGSGDDLLRSTLGDDLFIGGAGADTFVFAPRTGRDVIRGFDAQEDLIDLQDVRSIVDFEDLIEHHAVEHGHQVILQFGHGHTVRIANTALDDLTSTNVLI